MRRKYSYNTTPILCWCVIDNSVLDNVMKTGIKPEITNITDIPGRHHKKVIYGVRIGDIEALSRLKALIGIENLAVVKAAIPAYYRCIQETPETSEEKEFCSEFGTPHQDILFIPNAIKSKYIISVETEL